MANPRQRFEQEKGSAPRWEGFQSPEYYTWLEDELERSEANRRDMKIVSDILKIQPVDVNGEEFISKKDVLNLLDKK